MDAMAGLRALAGKSGRLMDSLADRQQIVDALRERRRRKDDAYNSASFALAAATSFEGLEDFDEESKLAFVELVEATPANELLDHPEYPQIANLLALKERFGNKWQDILATTNSEHQGQYIGDGSIGQYVGSVADKRLEMELVRNLNAGENIDGYSLPDGARASLAPPNHETYDILVHDAEGNLLPSVSVKMTAVKRTAQAALVDLEEAGGGHLLTNAEALDVAQGEVHQSDVSADELKADSGEDLDAWTEPANEELGEEMLADSAFLGGTQSFRLLLRMARNRGRRAPLAEDIDWHEEAFRGGTNFVALTGANAAEYLLLDAGPAALDLGGFGVGIGIRAAIKRTRSRYRTATTLTAYGDLLKQRFPTYAS